MDDTIVSLAQAKARLSELTERAAAGEEVVITKRGRPVASLSSLEATRRSIDLGALRALTSRMVGMSEDSETFMRRIRAESRY